MTDMAWRERRYRRLLRVYPSQYRRVRGDEIITTLMDAAAANRTSSIREEVALLLGGVRQRFATSGLAFEAASSPSLSLSCSAWAAWASASAI